MLNVFQNMKNCQVTRGFSLYLNNYELLFKLCYPGKPNLPQRTAPPAVSVFLFLFSVRVCFYSSNVRVKAPYRILTFNANYLFQKTLKCHLRVHF